MLKSLLTPEQWAEARRLRAEGATFAAIGKHFGISGQHHRHRARRRLALAPGIVAPRPTEIQGLAPCR